MEFESIFPCHRKTVGTKVTHSVEVLELVALFLLKTGTFSAKNC